MPFLVFILVVFLWFAMSRRARSLEREIERLRRRLDELERVPRPAATPAPTIAAPLPDPLSPQFPPPPAGARDLVEPLAFPASTAPHAPPPSPDAPPPPAPRIDLEQLVGGVWLQNVGAVLLLVGVFFLIFWGYTTGRLGPGALVIAGVLAGLGLVWRGDRLQRSVRGLGHALIGVGAGVVWLTLYLGHFTLHALPAPLAFPLMLAASVLTGGLGLRYGAQSIAALGVVGAFLPHALQSFVPLYGFSLPAGALLGYLAVLDTLVFVLAARAGWTGLALASLLLTAATWIAAVPASRWSWPLEIGLAALFAGLGVAPIPRLARVEGTVRPVDLAVIAVAPLALVASSWPMFELARPIHVAILLLALAVLYLSVAAWVDSRRPERDLWRPLTAAATLFLTAAIERAVSRERTPLAWTIEGVTLVLLGLAPRAGWLRLCGYVVTALGAGSLFIGMVTGFANGHPLPVANADAIRDVLAIAALLFGAHRLGRERERLNDVERAFAKVWFIGAHLLLMIWLAREAHHLAWALENGSGAWRRLPDIRAASYDSRYWSLLIAATGLAWLAQAAWLVWTGKSGGLGVARGFGHVEALLAMVGLVCWLLGDDGWARDRLPIVHRDGLLVLGAIVLVIAAATNLARDRAALAPIERRMPEVWGAGASFLLVAWIAREADHVARVLVDVPGLHATGWDAVPQAIRVRLQALAATLTSVGWLAQAIATFAVGWVRRSAFLRWMGLALVGITVLKFLLVDLAHADPFWRFLIAIVVGAAMLGLSYAYQRSGGGRMKRDEP